MTPLFEPVVFFDTLLDSLKQMQLQEASLAQRVSSLEQRRRTTASKDAAGWIAVYEETLALLPLALRSYKDQQQQRAKAQEEAAARAALAQRINQLAPQVTQLLQREQSNWGGRLAQQLQQFQDKVERSVLRLELSSLDLPETGETLFEIEAVQLQEFWKWLQQAEQTWHSNNEALVAERINESLKELGLTKDLSFQVNPARIPENAANLPCLKGHKILTPIHQELLAAIKTRLSNLSSSQAHALQKHLRDEELRWNQFVRQQGGGGLPGLGTPPPMAPVGVPPATLDKMAGPWPAESQARIAQLRSA